MQETGKKDTSQKREEDLVQHDILRNRDVHGIKFLDRTIFLVGTAHVSKESQILVKEVIMETRPDILCIELDERRFDAITDPNRWQNLNIFDVIRKKQTFFLIAKLLLAGFQKKIGQKLGVRPGSEMLEAVHAADELNIPVALVDRDVAITLRRVWRKTPFFKKFLMLANLISGFFSKQKIDEEELENLRKSDVITEIMKELKKYLPEAAGVLVDERDRYIVRKTLDSSRSLKKVVLVVGAGHVAGIKRYLAPGEMPEVSLKELENIPDTPFLQKLLPWIIPALISIAIISGFATQDYSTMKRSAIIWIMVNGISGALGALAAFAHPLSILIAFLSAPITSLNPTIGCGFVVGIAEAIFRKPRVSDFETLSDDIGTLHGWYRNRLTRILLVFAGSSLGSAIGTWIAISWLVVS